MPNHTLCNEKDPVSCRSSTAASEPSNKGSQAHGLCGNLRAPYAPGVTANPDNNVLIVDWSGPDDPSNPKNWSLKKKWTVTIVASAFAFISPVSSSMVAPASNQVAADFAITSEPVLVITVTVFLLAQALGPLVLAPLSELYGRSGVVLMANLWYLAWNMGCGFARNTGELIAFRFLSGLGGSAALSVCGAVISDTWNPEQRGMAMGLYTLAPYLGPAVGPIAGSWIAEKSRWRWVFWSTSIFDVFVHVLGLIFLEESFAPVLLERRAKAIRKTLADPEKGCRPREVRTIYTSADRHWKALFKGALTRPFVFFFREPIIQFVGLYTMFVYGLLYLFLNTVPAIFRDVYHENIGIAGLNYIALGIGITGASQTSAAVTDKLYAKLKRKYEVGKPEFRILAFYPSGVLLPLGLLITGWSVENRVHWIWADVGLAFVGAGVILVFQNIQTYIIDCYALHAASALAAVFFFRSLAGFCFPVFAPVMFRSMGYGLGSTVLAIFAVVIGVPAPILFWKFGERIRNQSVYAVKTPSPTPGL